MLDESAPTSSAAANCCNDSSMWAKPSVSSRVCWTVWKKWFEKHYSINEASSHNIKKTTINTINLGFWDLTRILVLKFEVKQNPQDLWKQINTSLRRSWAILRFCSNFVSSFSVFLMSSSRVFSSSLSASNSCFLPWTSSSCATNVDSWSSACWRNLST